MAAIDKYTRTTEILWRKRDCAARVGPCPLPGQAVIVFSRPITSGMVLIYYAEVCFGWLSFTDNKGEDVAKYIKEGYLQM